MSEHIESHDLDHRKYDDENYGFSGEEQLELRQEEFKDGLRKVLLQAGKDDLDPQFILDVIEEVFEETNDMKINIEV